MKKIILYISYFLVISSCANAAVLQFSDNGSIVKHEKSLRNKSLHSIDSLYSYFLNQGYLDIAVTQNSDTLFLATGIQYELRNIYIDSILLTKAPIQKSFSQKNLSAEIDNILLQEKIDGYQFVTLKIESTIVSNNFVDLFCSLNKGPQVMLDSLWFEGLTKTKNSLLYRYIDIKKTLITPKLLQEIEEDALSIPFVQFIPPIKQELNQGYTSANLIIPFIEKDNLLFEGGGGYLSESDLFVWNMSLNFQNIFGDGREISIISQKKDINHQHLALNYKQPIFLFGIGSAGMSVQTRDYREQFYEFIISSQMQTYFKKKINLGFDGQYKSVEQENDNLSYSSTQLSFSISNKNSVSIKYNSDKLLYDWRFSYGRRKYKTDSSSVLTSHSSFNESRIEINTQFFKSLISPMMLFIDMNFKSYQTDENLPPFAELYLIGGTNSIRGFKDEQFPSIRNFTATIESQYQFDSGNLFLFYDGGYIYNRTVSETVQFDETTIYRYGYGGGISLLNNSNSLKMSFGWNKNLTFDNPRISIQLKTGL